MIDRWGRAGRISLRKGFVDCLIDTRLPTLTVLDKSSSPKQKYRVTPAGAQLLSNVDGFLRLQRATTKRGRQP